MYTNIPIWPKITLIGNMNISIPKLRLLKILQTATHQANPATFCAFILASLRASLYHISHIYVFKNYNINSFNSNIIIYLSTIVIVIFFRINSIFSLQFHFYFLYIRKKDILYDRKLISVENQSINNKYSPKEEQ